MHTDVEVTAIRYRRTVFTHNWPYSANGQWGRAMCWITSTESSWGSPPSRCCLLQKCGKISNTALEGDNVEVRMSSTLTVVLLSWEDNLLNAIHLTHFSTTINTHLIHLFSELL